MYDCIVIGMGPAGMSSALYASKANLKTLILESESPGGLLNKIKNIDNLIGYPNISGSDLAFNMFNHIRKENIEYKICKVLRIEDKNDYKVIYTTKGEFKSKGVIIACGRKLKKTSITNEDKYINKGISYCAICDASLYKDKNVILIGNDSVAYEEALYLKDICSNIKIVTNNNEITFDNKDNIEVINDKVINFTGSDYLDGLNLENNNHISCDGVFIYNGYSSNSAFISELNITDEKGYIIVNDKMQTSIKNIYACGDIIKKDIYQVSTAISEGCIASINLNKSIKENNNDFN